MQTLGTIRDASPSFVEVQCTSNFTFLTGASHPDELVQQAAALGYTAIGLTDTHTLAGIVRAHVAAKEAGIQLLVGSRITVPVGEPPCPPLDILLYPTDLPSYGRLCQLLTLGKRRAPKGECHLTLQDVIEHQRGLLAVVIPPVKFDLDCVELLTSLRHFFDDDRLSIAAACLYGPDDRRRLAQLVQLSQHVAVPLVATNDVHYHHPDRRPLQDVLTCIRRGCSLEQAGLALLPHAERHLKPAHEMARLFAEFPQAIQRTLQIAPRCAGFNLDQLRYEYPDEIVPTGSTPMSHLIDLTWRGARERYPAGVPEKVRSQIEHEIQIIGELNYAPYFLTVYDLVKFARSRDILCQGRGAAANSAVCYCLGVTSVDPHRIDMLFERFVSKERDEPPDIDVDFEHERREEVIQYIYGKYGRERAAICAVVITYRSRSALRDVGKALGLEPDALDRLAKNIDHSSTTPVGPEHIEAVGLNPGDPAMLRLARLTNELLGFPRHLSQHVGGFVITRRPLCELVPIENAAMVDRTVIEWDKDDIDAMNMLKVDVLALGMLTCIRKAIAMVNESDVRETGCGVADTPLQLHTIPSEDPAVYDMICRADTIGVFQIESRAQMSMLPRLKPRCFYDLVIEVSIVRPGPIQGNMVHPYLRRRQGLEVPPTFKDPGVAGVLEKTLGVPLFQEQAMKLAIVAAGFTPGEADQLRRAIKVSKARGDKLAIFGQRIITGMVRRGHDRAFAERCFEQIKGFSGYGFPESHAASFALLVYASAWLKRHHPAAFAAALLNSQPMGFYAPAQIVRDAQAHGVEARAIDVNFSAWDCTLETDPDQPPALRLGMRMARGLGQDEADAIATAVRDRGPFKSIVSLWRQLGNRVRVTTLRALAAADAFRSMGLDRQQALWQCRALHDEKLPLFEQPSEPRDHGPTPPAPLPPIPEIRHVFQDYATVGLSLKRHPIAYLRKSLARIGAVTADQLADEIQTPTGRWITIAGVCLMRQQPSTAKGILFMTIEDETASANLILRPPVYRVHRRAARSSALLICGKVERQGQVVHVIAQQIRSLDPHLQGLVTRSRDFH